MTNDALDAWLYGTRVARVVRGPGRRPRLSFTGEALERWGLNSSVVSGLLPLSTQDPHPARVSAWLAGLLPEGRARTAAAARAGVDPDDLLGFLAVYGRDTAGALVLVPEGDDPDVGGRPVPVSDDQIAQLLEEARLRGAADQLTSLGGVETKIVLTRTDDGWALPTGRAPSTHIVKLSRPSDSLAADLIDTEAASLALAQACHLTSVRAEIVEFAGARTIVVERYDRRARPDGSVDRIHQEDGAQLLGIDTSDPERKFQWGRRLPSLAALARKLTDMGRRPVPLLALTTFNLAIGNTDAHAKNVSVIHDPSGATTLAPAYDIAMHLHHVHAGARFAMDVDGRNDMTTLSADDLVAEGRSWGLTPREAIGSVVETLTVLRSALASVDRAAHPGVAEQAWHTVESRTAQLLELAPPLPLPSRRSVHGAPPGRAPRGTPAGGRFTTSEGPPST